MVTLRQTAAMCPKELGEELLFRYIQYLHTGVKGGV